MHYSAHVLATHIQITDEILTGENVEKYVQEDDQVHSGSIVSEAGTALDLRNMTATASGAAEYPVVLLQVDSRHGLPVGPALAIQTQAFFYKLFIKNVIRTNYICVGNPNRKGIRTGTHDRCPPRRAKRQGRFKHATPFAPVGEG